MGRVKQSSRHSDCMSRQCLDLQYVNLEASGNAVSLVLMSQPASLVYKVSAFSVECTKYWTVDQLIFPFIVIEHNSA